ncbi:interleukin-15-like isoform X2 [Notolabrus celidotus]|uniref:interleukin-15-like isoform X2 n=1 Tax=Notolabrus celidotus TaxID=1203425 RepID=UPI0014908455|nr:interleukin-15-like isoform X2 [Notolabrus celidotus]
MQEKSLHLQGSAPVAAPCCYFLKNASRSSWPVTCVQTATKLSFLSTCTCAVSSKDIEHFNICLDHLKSSIQKSDAMLYAPSTNDVKPACVNMSLNCYMLELKMVIDEEDVWNNYTQCINEFALSLSSSANAVGCPPCEAYSPQNITIFLERLNTLLQRFTVLL